jgi:methylated-DNA-[protein]-cysteine S-methyltransferase
MSFEANYDALINAPFGAVAISVHGNQLAINLLSESLSAENKPSTQPVVKRVYEQILQYLWQPTAKFDLPINVHGTAFQQRVWQAIVAIPAGQTYTYGQLAKEVGSGPRAVANACGANNIPIVIPCHRVVAQHGIGGFMQGKQNAVLIKQWLLAHEGVHGYKHE